MQNHLNQLKKALAALKPLQNFDPIYSDCISHLRSALRKQQANKTDGRSTTGDDNPTTDVYDIKFKSKP